MVKEKWQKEYGEDNDVRWELIWAIWLSMKCVHGNITHILTLFYVTPDSKLGETETCLALAKDIVMHTPWMHKGKKRYSPTHTLLTVTIDEGMWSALPPPPTSPPVPSEYEAGRGTFFLEQKYYLYTLEIWYNFPKIIVAGSPCTPCIQSFHILGTFTLTWRKFNYWNVIGLLFKVSIWLFGSSCE